MGSVYHDIAHQLRAGKLHVHGSGVLLLNAIKFCFHRNADFDRACFFRRPHHGKSTRALAGNRIHLLLCKFSFLEGCNLLAVSGYGNRFNLQWCLLIVEKVHVDVCRFTRYAKSGVGVGLVNSASLYGANPNRSGYCDIAVGLGYLQIVVRVICRDIKLNHLCIGVYLFACNAKATVYNDLHLAKLLCLPVTGRGGVSVCKLSANMYGIAHCILVQLGSHNIVIQCVVNA